MNTCTPPNIRSSIRLLVTILLTMLSSATSHAGLLEGLNAYKKADYVTAEKELKPLAEKGNAQAQNTLGRMYSLGQGGARDARGAAEWFLKAAEQGHSEAQGMLGYLYLVGDGAPQNNGKAYEWTLKAAEQGDVMAQYNLAVMLSSSIGIKKNPPESVKWLRKAAEQGHAGALNALAVVYQQGLEGVKESLVLAHMFLALAETKGFPGAAIKLKALEASMPADQVKEGKRLARAWKPGTPLPNKA